MGAKIIPSIRYKDCKKAVDWLCEAFGFEEHLIVPSDTGAIHMLSSFIKIE